MQPKKQFKVQIVGFMEEIDSFSGPKMHLWKGQKKFGQGPPLIWTKSKRRATFFRETFPNPQIRKIRQKGVGGSPIQNKPIT